MPASLVGREQQIDVGPMSGKSNVVFWLESRGLPATDDVVDRIFSAAKASNRTLTSSRFKRFWTRRSRALRKASHENTKNTKKK